MNRDNDWYGHKGVLARYCGVSGTPPMYAYLPHGWDPDMAFDMHRRFTSAPLLLWNARHGDALEARGVGNLAVVGAPFAYLARMRGATSPQAAAPSAEASGTIAFPAHSAEQELNHATETFIALVESVAPPPYTVSVYYRDRDKPAMRRYEEAGWRVVSFGSRLTTSFLDSVYDALSEHAVMVSNEVSSALWYAGLLGLRCQVIEDGTWPLPAGSHPAVARDNWPELLAPDTPVAHTQELARFELGVEHLLPPDDLRRLVGWDSTYRRTLARLVRTAVDFRYRADPADR